MQKGVGAKEPQGALKIKAHRAAALFSLFHLWSRRQGSLLLILDDPSGTIIRSSPRRTENFPGTAFPSI
jgi:hypothetical protein